MNLECAIIIIIIIIVIFKIYKSHKFSISINLPESLKVRGSDNTNYKVIEYFKDPQKAADMLAELNALNVKLIDTLREEYVLSNKRKGEIKFKFKRNLIKRLYKRYDGSNMEEIDPPDKHNTAWSDNKGETIAYCLREIPGSGDDLVDFGVLMYVNLHELAHVAAKGYGHDYLFWLTYRFLLRFATNIANVYNPVDYKETPINYCRLDIDVNEYYEVDDDKKWGFIEEYGLGVQQNV
jgi:hypothetical protein